MKDSIQPNFEQVSLYKVPYSLVPFSLCENCPSTKFVLVRIFHHLDLHLESGKYGPEKISYLDTFHAVLR